MKRFIVALPLLFSFHLSAQGSDSIPVNAQASIQPTSRQQTFLKAPYSGFIIPAVFISYGFLAQKADGLQKLDDNVQRKVSARFTGRTYVDDYTQYVPIAAVFGLDLTGMKATHNLRDRTFLAASSFLFSSVCVQSLKRTMRVARPDGSNNKSFPSGHTATTFAGAHLLFKEYKDVSPWIGVAGYIIATGTGALRIRNQKHWVSDVVAGAGFGIISVEASYLLLPVFQHITGVKDTRTNLSIAPMIGFYQYGIGLAYTF